MFFTTWLFFALNLTECYYSVAKAFDCHFQGMNDILTRFLVVMDSEVDAYWCFSNYMEEVEKDFDEHGMIDKLTLVQKLLIDMEPNLYRSDNDYAEIVVLSSLMLCNTTHLVYCFQFVVKWMLVENFLQHQCMWIRLWWVFRKSVTKAKTGVTPQLLMQEGNQWWIQQAIFVIALLKWILRACNDATFEQVLPFPSFIPSNKTKYCKHYGLPDGSFSDCFPPKHQNWICICRGPSTSLQLLYLEYSFKLVLEISRQYPKLILPEGSKNSAALVFGEPFASLKMHLCLGLTPLSYQNSILQYFC